MRTFKRFFNKFVIFVIFLNTQIDLFIVKTDVEMFTSTNKKTLHLIFKASCKNLYMRGWRQACANLHELEKAIRQKWNEIEDQTGKAAILQWKMHVTAVTKQNFD